MLTKRTKYALNALIHLAVHAGAGQPVMIAEVARAKSIPRKFLERILLDLKRHGYLESRMGKGGGYLLARPADRIWIGDVVRLMDGPLAPVSCVSQTAYRRCPECGDEAGCGIRAVMKDVRDAIAEILDHTSLADMVERGRAGSVQRGLVYDI